MKKERHNCIQQEIYQNECMQSVSYKWALTVSPTDCAQASPSWIPRERSSAFMNKEVAGHAFVSGAVATTTPSPHPPPTLPHFPTSKNACIRVIKYVQTSESEAENANGNGWPASVYPCADVANAAFSIREGWRLFSLLPQSFQPPTCWPFSVFCMKM
jgi:hypothetical protein